MALTTSTSATIMSMAISPSWVAAVPSIFLSLPLRLSAASITDSMQMAAKQSHVMFVIVRTRSLQAEECHYESGKGKLIVGTYTTKSMARMMAITAIESRKPVASRISITPEVPPVVPGRLMVTRITITLNADNI